ncbi:MAG: hypothetical protein WD939_08705 [Dehalococcoidia bacterium]
MRATVGGALQALPAGDVIRTLRRRLRYDPATHRGLWEEMGRVQRGFLVSQGPPEGWRELPVVTPDAQGRLD